MHQSGSTDEAVVNPVLRMSVPIVPWRRTIHKHSRQKRQRQRTPLFPEIQPHRPERLEAASSRSVRSHVSTSAAVPVSLPSVRNYSAPPEMAIDPQEFHFYYEYYMRNKNHHDVHESQSRRRKAHERRSKRHRRRSRSRDRHHHRRRRSHSKRRSHSRRRHSRHHSRDRRRSRHHDSHRRHRRHDSRSSSSSSADSYSPSSSESSSSSYVDEPEIVPQWELVSQRRRSIQRHNAARTIQRFFRGYLRSKAVWIRRRKMIREGTILAVSERVIDEYIREKVLPSLFTRVFGGYDGEHLSSHGNRCYYVFERVRNEVVDGLVRRLVRQSLADWIRVYFEKKSDGDTNSSKAILKRYPPSLGRLLNRTADTIIAKTVDPIAKKVVRRTVREMVNEYLVEMRSEKVFDYVVGKKVEEVVKNEVDEYRNNMVDTQVEEVEKMEESENVKEEESLEDKLLDEVIFRIATKPLIVQ